MSERDDPVHEGEAAGAPRSAADEFFIGWEARLPRRTAAFLFVVVLGVVALAGLSAGLLALGQGSFARSDFEFGVPRDFTGRLELVPYPTLVVERPGGAESRWLVTVFGKRGAEPETRALDGHRVEVSGSLIHRGDHTMVEIDPATLRDLGEERAPALPPPGAEVTLRGEIVDSKCWLGVMKPGNLKPHRACAAACIRGGVPPALVVRETGEPPRYLLLVGADGAPLAGALLPFVAEPVEVTGRLQDLGSIEALVIDPASTRRID